MFRVEKSILLMNVIFLFVKISQNSCYIFFVMICELYKINVWINNKNKKNVEIEASASYQFLIFDYEHYILFCEMMDGCNVCN